MHSHLSNFRCGDRPTADATATLRHFFPHRRLSPKHVRLRASLLRLPVRASVNVMLVRSACGLCGGSGRCSWGLWLLRPRGMILVCTALCFAERNGRQPIQPREALALGSKQRCQRRAHNHLSDLGISTSHVAHLVPHPLASVSFLQCVTLGTRLPRLGRRSAFGAFVACA